MFDHTSRQIFENMGIWEAPTFLPDGNALLATSNGVIYKMVFQDDGSLKPEKLAIPDEYQCTNDRAVSPDGKLLAFSAIKASATTPHIYVANLDGTNIQQVTTEGPSLVHGWSPDSKTVVFAAQRKDSKQFDIYSAPITGGKETLLIADTHQDESPELSPDGKWLYFSSNRSGHNAIWRAPMTGLAADETKAEKVIDDGQEDRFPHIAQSGGRINYIAYPAGSTDGEVHTLHVELKGALIDGEKLAGAPSLLVGIIGAKGSLDSNAWNPDSDGFAYVMYDEIP